MRRSLSIVALLLVSAAPAFAQRYTVFPQFASGNGWTSTLFFTNQGLSAVSGITVYFYETNGEAVSVETNLGYNSTFSFDLDAGASKVIRITPSGGLMQGYVLAEYPSSGSPVRATEVYRLEQGGIVAAEVGVSQQELGEHFSFPVDVNPSEQVYTAIALVNMPIIEVSEPTTLIMHLIREDGTVQAVKTLDLQPWQQVTGFLDQEDWFPELHNSSFTGSLSVSSPLGVGVLALRQDKNAYGAISTDGGPILGVPLC
jgi:hypothetical protein